MDGSDLRRRAPPREEEAVSQGMYTAGKWLDSDREYEKNGPGVMSFFTQFNGGKQDKVEDRARQNGISQDARPLARRRRAVGEARLEDQGVEARRGEGFGLF